MKTLEDKFKISRKTYLLIMALTSFLGAVVIYLFQLATKLKPEIISHITLIPFILIVAALLYVQIRAAIGRMKDVGISPYWSLCFAIPMVNIILGIYLLIKSGVNGGKAFDENIAYKLVASEIANDSCDEGLWLKAYSQTSGDETKTKIKYIKLRIDQLKALETSGVSIKNSPAISYSFEFLKRDSLIIVLIASITYAIILIAMNNDAVSETVAPRPFAFQNRDDVTDCSINYSYENVSIDELKLKASGGDWVAYMAVPKYYLYGSHKDFNKAHEILNERISSKNRFYHSDLYVLGKLHECGYSVPKDIDKAISYYETAKSYKKLSTIYMMNKDIAANYEKAFYFQRLDAENKNYKADLAAFYYYGIGVNKDLKESFKLQKQTIDYFEKNGLDVGIEDYFNLGLMYYYGFGVFQSNEQAKNYLLKTLNKFERMDGSVVYAKNISELAHDILLKINEK